MDITYYAFAAYIFLLVCGGIWFFAKVFRGGKGKGGDKSSYEKEQRLFTLYQNVEEMLSSFEELAEETRKETEATLKKAEEMLEEARQLSAQTKGMKAGMEPAVQRAVPRGVRWNEPREEMTETPPELTETPVRETKRAAYRPAPVEEEAEDFDEPPLKMNEKILLLNAQGFSAAEIAKTLGISVREVTLALEMARK